MGKRLKNILFKAFTLLLIAVMLFAFNGKAFAEVGKGAAGCCDIFYKDTVDSDSISGDQPETKRNADNSIVLIFVSPIVLSVAAAVMVLVIKRDKARKSSARKSQGAGSKDTKTDN